MGTKAYVGHRRRGWYLITKHSRRSFPAGVGLNFARTIPRDSDVYQQWLEDIRAEIDVVIEDQLGKDPDWDPEPVPIDGEILARRPPCHDDSIEWIYEVDLDNEVFLVDRIPLFRLSNMPSDKLFLESIDKDSYGNRGYNLSLPEEHRYNWTSSPPPVPRAVIRAYKAVTSADALPIHQLLSIHENLSCSEKVRVRLYEVIIGCMMRYGELSSSLRALENIPSVDQMPTNMTELCQILVSLAIKPAIYRSDAPFMHQINFDSLDVDADGVLWFTPQAEVCLVVGTHLDDESNLGAVVMKILAAAKKRFATSMAFIVYGVALSLFHCSIVCVDRRNGTHVVKHTPALQFIPSFHTTSPSTAGITALMRLGCIWDPLPVFDYKLTRSQLSRDLKTPQHQPDLRFTVSEFDVEDVELGPDTFTYYKQQMLKQYSASGVLAFVDRHHWIRPKEFRLTFWMQVASHAKFPTRETILDRVGARQPRTILDKVPLEIWTEIGSYLIHTEHLLRLADLTPSSWRAVNDIMRFPHIGNHRLTGIYAGWGPWYSCNVYDARLWTEYFTTIWCDRPESDHPRDTALVVSDSDHLGAKLKWKDNLFRDIWLLDNCGYDCWSPVHGLREEDGRLPD